MDNETTPQAKTWRERFNANPGPIGLVCLVVVAVVTLSRPDVKQPSASLAQGEVNPEQLEAYRAYEQFVVDHNMILDQAPAAFGLSEAQLIESIRRCMRFNMAQSGQARATTLDCRRVDLDVAMFGPRRVRPETPGASS